MNKNLDLQIKETLKAYLASGVEDQGDYQKFYLYSIVTHSPLDGNGRTTRLVMNMVQRQLGLIPSIVRKEDKGEYIQSLVDSREQDNSTIAQDIMLQHYIANLNRRVREYQESIMKDK